MTTARSLYLPLLLLAVLSPAALSQDVTGLAGWSIFLDPGHSQTENAGIYGYSEAEKNVRVALALRELLLERTDIDTVYISRTNDAQSVSLADRVLMANLSGAAFFQSIHSNAAGPSTNYVFVLWPQHKTGEEVSPTGGRRMADLASALLGRGMRIESYGGRGECDFYGADHCRTPGDSRPDLGGGKGGSRNFVQSYTNMASSLSEAGFHTNPDQNVRNMNADWKRLEAQSIFWSILVFHGLPRPVERILTGLVRDLETGRPINGARVRVGDAGYTTDTWQALFHRFTADSTALGNGFYYLADLPAGPLSVSVEADGYEPFQQEVVAADSFFTFLDVDLVFTAPVYVAATDPADGETSHRIVDNIVIDFSRRMDRTATETAFSIEPPTSGGFLWSQNDTRLTFRPDSLQPRTAYAITIGEGARGAFGHDFDGDRDGEPGGTFTFAFETGYRDITPPIVRSSYPRGNATEVELQPALSLVYSEPVDSLAFEGRVTLERADTGAPVAGIVAHDIVRERSILTFFPQTELEPGTAYRLVVDGGVADRFGNVDPTSKQLRFTTGTLRFVASRIDDFEADFLSDWWVPQQSGSTTGILTDSTGVRIEGSTVNLISGSTAAMRLDFGWDATAESALIREYLGGGAPRSVEFDATVELQAMVFGDGSGVLFRFAVDDNVPATAANYHEVSPWIPVDWYGWRPVTWNLATDGTGVWLGDGVVQGRARFDSFQLARESGRPSSGSLVIDDLRFGRSEPVSTLREDAEPVADSFALEAAYPNPFSQTTRLAFRLTAPETVTLEIYDVLGRVVASPFDAEWLPPGRHEVLWDAGSLPSGSYFARLWTPERQVITSLVLVR